MPVILNELLMATGLVQVPDGNVEISGLTADSRLVAPGCLFAALPGSKTDGRAFVSAAIAQGAAAILAPAGSNLALSPSQRDAATIIFDEAPRRRFAQMAAVFYGLQPKTIAAVTGTNGKTSVAHFCAQLWKILGRTSGYMGTLGAWGGGLTVSGSLTTPEPVRLHQVLADLARSGVSHLAMEASSHGLEQNRVDGVHVTVAAFTNLSRDHLDYHGTMDAYLAAKARLFADVLAADGIAVLNADIPEFEYLKGTCEKAGRRVMSYGKNGRDVRLAAIAPSSATQALEIEVAGRTYAVTLPLAGRFQADNALCALGCVIASGAEASLAVAALEQLEGVPGRMELAGKTPAGAPIYVDYAHTPDALATALKALRPHTEGKLTVVFGCGGDRDRGKRPLMGRCAADLADIVIVTDDNPRTEKADAIRREILSACPGATEIGDRAAAIEHAIRLLGQGDLLLVAGKGHESGQIVGAEILPFNDVEVVKRALAAQGRKA